MKWNKKQTVQILTAANHDSNLLTAFIIVNIKYSIWDNYSDTQVTMSCNNVWKKYGYLPSSVKQDIILLRISALQTNSW